MKRRVMYVELKTSNENGPAWIGWVSFSKSGRTVYYRGRALKRIKGGGISGNHVDVVTGDEYWISGPKKNREDRHWAGSGPVEIDPDAKAEYERIIDG
jgi:hypothetical protein